MPIYEFKCKNCGHKFEELVFSSHSETKDILCPKCGKKNAEKLLSAFSSCAASSAGSSASSSCASSRFT